MTKKIFNQATMEVDLALMYKGDKGDKGDPGETIASAYCKSDGTMVLTMDSGRRVSTNLQPLTDSMGYAESAKENAASAASSASAASISSTGAASSASEASSQAKAAADSARDAATSKSTAEELYRRWCVDIVGPPAVSMAEADLFVAPGAAAMAAMGR